MFIWPIVLLGLIVAIFYLVARSSDGAVRLNPAVTKQTPIDILDERLARGDIDQQEYDEKRRVLEHG